MFILSLVVAAVASTPAAETVARLRCGRDPVTAVYRGGRLDLAVGGKRYALARARAASGTYYRGSNAEFREHHGAATLTIAGHAPLDCLRVEADAGGVYYARGQKPGWTLVLFAGHARLDYDGNATLDQVLPPVRTTASGRHYASRALTIDLTRTACVDPLSGKSFPETVRVVVGARVLHGCGGAATGSIENVEWLVENIGGGGVIDGSRVTIEVHDKRVVGRAGCNRYSASAALDGKIMKIGPVIATRMACAQAVMDQETKFMDILQGVMRYRLTENGALIMTAADGRTIIARRAS